MFCTDTERLNAKLEAGFGTSPPLEQEVEAESMHAQLQLEHNKAGTDRPDSAYVVADLGYQLLDPTSIKACRPGSTLV